MAETSAKNHLIGLDTLRFAAAAWVAASHGARLPLDKMLPAESLPGKVLVALNNGIFNGPAAVLLFFVVSGFVIHRPYIGKDHLDLRSFYARRLTRIVPPTIAILAICWAAGPIYFEKLSSVMWSLYCEIAYYLIYPALFLLFRRGLTGPTFLATTAIALVIIAATWPVLYYWEFSMPVMIVIGLPNWILGCLLAEAVARRRDTPGTIDRSIWAWRLGAIALTAAFKVPVTHGPIPIGYPASLWLFAIYCYFWVGYELAYFRHHAHWDLLEKFGSASFSLYLVHNPVIGLFESLRERYPGLDQGLVSNIAIWAAQICAIAAATYVFYRCVEYPFHRLARKLGARPASSPAAVGQQAGG